MNYNKCKNLTDLLGCFDLISSFFNIKYSLMRGFLTLLITLKGQLDAASNVVCV